MNLTELTVQTAPERSIFEEKIADLFCKILHEKSGLDICRSKNAGAVTVEFYREDGWLPADIANLFSEIARPGKEGYRIRFLKEEGQSRLIVLGREERGEFYGMAWILRKAKIREGSVEIPESLDGVSMTPEYPLRGHQLGYRDKNNTYSAWTAEDFEAYIQDLALFGANAIELLPPKTDDNLYSATFLRDPFAIMKEVSAIIHSYHMDVWLWYPNVGKDYTDWSCIDEELKEREKVFAEIPYLDAILVPLGDPGSLWPAAAFRLTEQFVRIMHKYHPQAKVWVAPQHFQPEQGWYDEFYEEIAKEPDWVDGVCFAPWEQHTVAEMVEKLPQKYRENIRNYPDISHNSNCQFPVPDWDFAFALTSGREGYNARPRQMKHIHNLIEPYTMGTITYSEGIHDDVNKFVWVDQDFDSKRRAEETLEEYVRLFIDSDMVDPLTEILLRLEDNWTGPAADNESIDTTYQKMREIDRCAPEKVKKNYRYQMLLLRVLTDYWTKQKYVYDQDLEKQALQVISQAKETGSASAIKEARSILNLSKDRPAAEDVLFEMERLSDFLRENCQIQLTVGHHGGQRWIRGAYLETREMPLNDYQYLMQRFKEIEKLAEEEQRIAALQQLTLRNNPGEGNLYCNLGTYEGFRHVVKNHTWEEDPGYLHTPLMDHSIYSIMGLFHDMRGWYTEFPMPLGWARNVTVLYGTPLEIAFDGLDPAADYTMQIFYPNSFLKAVHHMQKPEDDTLVHFYAGDILLADSIPREQLDGNAGWFYELPRVSYADGKVKLRWEIYDTLKAFAVSEIWICRKQ